jgi:hypothetical protein
MRDEARLAEFRAVVDEFMPKPFGLADVRERVVRLAGESVVDAEALANNRVVLLSKDPGRAEDELLRAGYRVFPARSPEEAGFLIGRERPDVMATEGFEEVADGVRKVRLDRSRPAPEQVEAAIGPVRARRAAAGSWVPWAAGAAVVLAVGAALVFRKPEPGGRGLLEGAGRIDEKAQWAELEKHAERHGLRFYEGTWLKPELLGEGRRLRLSDGRVLEGLVSEMRGGELLLRRGKETLKLSRKEVAASEPLRSACEEYWDREGKLAPGDAAAHQALALWCRENGLPEAARREIYHASRVTESATQNR